MTILNVGYGTTDPQKLLHLVQSNVTLILQDSRNNNEGTTNIEFIQGSGNFGENAFVDWQLSNSNSTFCIKRAFDNITRDVVIFSHDGNVNFSNNLSVNGTFIRNGTDIYTYFEDRIDSVSSSSGNQLDITSNILFLKSSNFDAHTSNYVLRIDREVNTRLDGVNNVDNILSFFKNTQFEKDNSDYINIKKASAYNIGGIMVDDDTITIDEFGVISGSQNIDLSDYATKSYVDGVATGLVFKDSAKVATTTNIASLSGTQIIDGVSVVIGDRVLVKNQSTQRDNGIYICSSGTWSRSTDFNQSSDNKGAFIFIDNGDTNGSTSFVCSNDSAITIGILISILQNLQV